MPEPKATSLDSPFKIGQTLFERVAIGLSIRL